MPIVVDIRCRRVVDPILVLLLLVAAVSFASAGVTFTQDFNAVRLPRVTDQVHPYPTWSVQVDGRVWYDVGFDPQGPDSSVCLVLRASTVDPGMTDAAVRLRMDLRALDPDVRLLLDPDAVLQWDWWYRDNRRSEAVGVRLIYLRDGVRETREHWNTPFYTPSDGFDPVLVWDCHRLDLGDLSTPCTDPAQTCIELEALEFELRGPVSQEIRLDNLYLGSRAGVEDCGEARVPGFVIQKLQSYSATTADLDRDGRWDLLLPGFLGRAAQFWAGRDPELRDTAALHGLDRYLGDVGVFLDLDNDGDQDLVLAHVERDGLRVLENVGRGRFADEPRVYPTRTAPLSISSIAAADADGDGRVDIYLASHDAPDVLMLNDGAGGFVPASVDLAEPLAVRHVSNGVLFSDIDLDGDQDLLVSGAGILRNDGANGFVVTGPVPTRGGGAMVEGMSVADFDGDGAWDLYLGLDQDSCRRSSSGRNILFWGSGSGDFARDTRSRAAVADDGHCEGVAAADLDNDGCLDLFIGNRAGPSLCLLGTGGGLFEPDRDRVFGKPEIPDLHGLCVLDRDDDGDLDLLVIRKHNDPLCLVNRTDNDRFLKVRLLGTESNWDAIGARAVLTHEHADGFLALRELRAGDGYQLSGPRELHFGLPDDGPFRLEVVFPSGRRVVRTGIAAGTRLSVVETDSRWVAGWHLLRRVHAPRWSARFADWPLVLQNIVLALLIAVLMVVSRPGLADLRLRRRPRIRPVGLGVLVVLAAGVAHHLGWQRQDAWGLAISLPAGAAVGASVPAALRFLTRRRAPLEVWDRLNEEFISYTHTGWCKNLEALIRQGGMLAGDLDPADRRALHERWQAEHQQFHGAVRAKLGAIAELGVLVAETRSVSADLAVGLKRMDSVRNGSPGAIAAGARDLRQTVDRLAAIVEARLSCRVDLALHTAWRASLTEFEALGIEASLDLGTLDGLRARIRDHELVMVLQDLLRNASVAASGSPAPAVAMRARADLRRVRLEILDNGPGLQGRDPEQLCQAGYTTREGGSGYGLFHARRVLGGYRGTLDLADRDGGGLAVTIGLLRPLHTRSELSREDS